uniref:Facilitated trehalose transporter Tret1-2 homolog n=1 Tax=Diabrotica virgifera virgifera TaxID=50390 RepID=A0A6P7G1H2_DIAVI
MSLQNMKAGSSLNRDCYNNDVVDSVMITEPLFSQLNLPVTSENENHQTDFEMEELYHDGIESLAGFIAFKLRHEESLGSSTNTDLPLITLGSCFVWGSPAIPKLRSNDTKINPLGEAITPFQTSVVVSASEFTMIFLLSVMAKVSNLLGRRKCLIIHSILFVIFLSAVAMARSIYVYYIFFLLNGMNLAGVFVNSTIYNSEVADDKSRAWMGVIDGLCLPLGTLLGFIFGSFTSIRVYSFLCATPALFYLLLSFYTVESPMYLLYKNKNEEALKVLKYLRKHKTMDEIQSEFKRMKDLSIEANHQRKNYDIFSTSSSRKALFIALSLCFFQQVTGVSNILAYAGTIFTEAGASVSGNTVSILMGTMQVVVNIMVVSSVNKIGRRRLVLASALGCSLSTFTLGIYLYLKSYSSVDNFNWLPVVCALTFIGSYALGLGPIVPSYMSELFPNEVRAMGVAIATTLEDSEANKAVDLFITVDIKHFQQFQHEELPISRSSAERKREAARQNFSTEIKSNLDIKEPIVVHWDNKFLPDILGSQKVDRLPVLVSYLVEMRNYWGVPKLASGTGFNTRDAVLKILKTWDLDDKVIGH